MSFQNHKIFSHDRTPIDLLKEIQRLFLKNVEKKCHMEEIESVEENFSFKQGKNESNAITAKDFDTI